MKIVNILLIMLAVFTTNNGERKIEYRGRINAKNYICDVKRVKDSGFIFETNENVDYYLEYENYIINGNYSNYSKDKLKDLISQEDKVCIFYNLNLLDNENSDYEIMKNNAVIYYYNNGIPSINTFKSRTTDIDDLKIEINDFVNKKLKVIGSTNMIASTYSVDDSLFIPIYSGSFREDGKPYGYIDGDYTVKKYRKNNVSSLYIIESHIAFTPGKVAIDLDANGYEKYYNSEGYIKVKALQAQDDVGYNQTRYGGTPIYKDAYPVNSPGKIEISSSFSAGVNLGYSFANGFSLDNISSSEENSYGVNINYSYSENNIQDEPALNAIKDPSDTKKCTWKYTYKNIKSETHHLNVGYMFEMNNFGHDLLEGAVAFQYEYEMGGKKSTSV